MEREKNNPANVLSDVYGVGPKKAKELVENGIKSIEELREKQDELLNATQRVGLKYYEDIQKRIPREEIDRYLTVFKDLFSEVSNNNNSKFEIVGSYRRGAKMSGDIDMIITANDPTIFSSFVDKLIEQKLVEVVLSRGKSKCLYISSMNPLPS